jgi:hypothetical protein
MDLTIEHKLLSLKEKDKAKILYPFSFWKDILKIFC